MSIETKHKNTLVSVVIPSYNHRDYIREAVLSVINQTYQPIELIVMDDGSTDNSPEILSELQMQYGFTLVCRPNKGLSRTLNEAIKEYAHGQYIAVLASDDYWVKEKTEKQVTFLDENPEIALAFGKAYAIDRTGNALPDAVDPVTDLTFEALIESNFIPATTVMFRKEAWAQCGGFKENSYVEDWDLWLKIAFVHKIAYLDEYFTYYRKHDTNMSSNVLKLYTCLNDIVHSWEDKLEPSIAGKVFIRRDSITFNVLARKHKRESLQYVNFSCAYWDRLVLFNYTKGLIKLLFVW